MTKILTRKPLAVAIRNSLIGVVAALGLSTASVGLAQNASGGNQQGQQGGSNQQAQQDQGQQGNN